MPSQNQVKNIGATLDSQLTMEKQVTAICKSAWCNLYQLSKIKKYLSEPQLQTAVLAYMLFQNLIRTTAYSMAYLLLLSRSYREFKMLQPVWCLEPRSMMMLFPCYTSYIGFQWHTESISKLFFSLTKLCMDNVLPTYLTYSTYTWSSASIMH